MCWEKCIYPSSAAARPFVCLLVESQQSEVRRMNRRRENLISADLLYNNGLSVSSLIKCWLFDQQALSLFDSARASKKWRWWREWMKNINDNDPLRTQKSEWMNVVWWWWLSIWFYYSFRSMWSKWWSLGHFLLYDFIVFGPLLATKMLVSFEFLTEINRFCNYNWICYPYYFHF
jgi:hypothetical protein